MIKVCIDLKKLLYMFRGGKGVAGQRSEPSPRAPLEQAQGKAGWVQLPVHTLLSTCVMQHSKMASNTFFCMSWRGKKALPEAQLFLHSSPKWRKVDQLLSGSESFAKKAQ